MLWEKVDDPRCGPQDVLVEVHACGLNHSDLDSRAETARWSLPLPWVLGAEFAGRVAQIGAEVEGIAAGDPVTAYQQYACGRCDACARWREDLCERFRVFGTDCWGGYGELVSVPARAIIPLRGEEDFIAAAAAQTVVSTAWSMVVGVAVVRAGETVLIPSASGGVASGAVQAACIAGARVIASVGSPEKIEPVRALGADVVFCHRETAVADAIGDATGGRGVDAVIDTTGGPLFADHLAAMARDGRLVTCGAHAGEVVPLDIVKLFQHGHRILGAYASGCNRPATEAVRPDDRRRLPMKASGALRAVLTALCMGAAGLAAATPAQAGRIADVRAQADRAWAQIQSDGQRLEGIVERSNGARLQLAQAEDSIRQNQKVLAATRVNLAHAESALSASLISAYKSPVPDPLEAALEAHNFGQVLEQFALLDRTNTYNANMLSAIRTYRVEIVHRQRTLARERDRRRAVAFELESLQARIRSSVAAEKRRYRGLREEVRQLIEARRRAEVVASQR